MAHKKGVGSTDNGRDSKSKRLGVKLFGGQTAKAGNIIIRQRGTKYHPGENVYMGKDFTIHAKVDGTVSFRKSHRNRMFVSIDPNAVNGGSQATDANLPIRKATVVEAKEAVAVEAPTPEAQAPEQVTPPTEDTRTPDVDDTPGEAASTVKFDGKTFQQDDLTIVEGIGPKIAELLQNGGINTWAELASSEVERVQEILTEAGSNFRTHNPGTWSRQAQLAVDGQWDELKTLQDELDGGKE